MLMLDDPLSPPFWIKRKTKQDHHFHCKCAHKGQNNKKAVRNITNRSLNSLDGQLE